MINTQKVLSQEQIEAFYHDDFVEHQVNDFINFFGTSTKNTSGRVVDIGGGVGFFAQSLQTLTDFKVRVLDTNNQSIEICKKTGIEALQVDALNPTFSGDENIVCFNLILHHLIGKSEKETRSFQERALSAWLPNASAVFINEYIYESFVINNISGWLIFQITSSSILSKLASFIAKVVPSLKANTFGVGVRFRSHDEWVKMFEKLGFDVVDSTIGIQERVSIPRKLLLIKNCRRDSFLLKPKLIKRAIVKEGGW